MNCEIKVNDLTYAVPEEVAYLIKRQNQRIGELSLRVDWLKDSECRRNEWLSRAKDQAGFDNSISFDEVWKVVLNVYLLSKE